MPEHLKSLNILLAHYAHLRNGECTANTPVHDELVAYVKNSHDALVAACKELITAGWDASNGAPDRRELDALRLAIKHGEAALALVEKTHA
jgi:hypothetical protein